MAITKIRKVGNSAGLLIPATLMNALRIREGDTVNMEVVDGAILVRPVSLKTQRLLERSEELLRTHRDALKGIDHE